MKLLRGVVDFSELMAGSALAIGNFDGMHCGHQALLLELKNQAARLKLPTLVIFFEPQPGEYFQHPTSSFRLMSRREKLDSLLKLGIDYVYCLSFNAQLAGMSAEDFAHRFIFALFHAKYILIGKDFLFGRDRLGTPALLARWARPTGCAVCIFPDYLAGSQRISSTAIRQALMNGDMQQAADWLGKPFAVSGRVIAGDGRGRQWGIPTANVQLPAHGLPVRGVFCVQVQRANQVLYWGVANVGRRPTIGGSALHLEVHLFDFSGSLYQERLVVMFLHRLRDEKTFVSVDALIAQIHLDLRSAQEFITHHHPIPGSALTQEH